METRNSRALSSALAMLRMLQPWALEFLNHLVTLVSASTVTIIYNLSILLICLCNDKYLYAGGKTYAELLSLPEH